MTTTHHVLTVQIRHWRYGKWEVRRVKIGPWQVTP